ncbi:hypothetical protein EDWATA_02665 [Edwardsiella tarda ATCC 23685]|uniref:Uncharacterized protein n=1 Tax=Edwardsiella tarda ATCC 23685 TaxID=500638 RepID=D4F7D0_EDWTA|nr:hypothetical protein EDWATA_02665 [Edwardsiella tarda ATCC 23685]
MLSLCLTFDQKSGKKRQKINEYCICEPDHGRLNCKSISLRPKNAVAHQQEKLFSERIQSVRCSQEIASDYCLCSFPLSGFILTD